MCKTEANTRKACVSRYQGNNRQGVACRENHVRVRSKSEDSTPIAVSKNPRTGCKVCFSGLSKPSIDSTFQEKSGQITRPSRRAESTSEGLGKPKSMRSSTRADATAARSAARRIIPSSMTLEDALQP